MKMICIYCGRDINAIGQDNVSYVSGMPICEDCAEVEECELRRAEENEAISKGMYNYNLSAKKGGRK